MADAIPFWPYSGDRLHSLPHGAQLTDELLIRLGGGEFLAHQVLDQG